MKYSLIILLLFIQVQLFAQRSGGGDNGGTGAEMLPDGNGCSSFVLKENKTYIISAWVKEQHATPQITYTSAIQISFTLQSTEPELLPEFGGNVAPDPNAIVLPLFTPSGNIIDGWQRIVGEFVVPVDKDQIKIELVADTDVAYFDDIRVHPYNGNLKSFAYDDETKRLMAELDNNNYATYYEYGLEGELVRVKKETERGVYTIQETRSSNAK